VTDPEFSSPFAAPGPQAPAGEPAADAPLAEIERKLAAALAEAEKLREDWLRAKADTENVRRRATEDVAKAHRFGIEGFAFDMNVACSSATCSPPTVNTRSPCA